MNKSPGHDEISFNVVKQVFQHIHKPLKHIFKLSLSKGIFPDELKIAKVTPIFKAGERSTLWNYRPISVLPCFSKILKKIMFSRLYQYLLSNNMLYKKQFGFQKATSTVHAIIELADQLHESFNENKFTIGVFIDLSKAFDTVNHKILLEKLNHYGIKGNNLKWFTSYLSKRKQFSMFNESEKSEKCGIPQGSVLGPLLFLLYVNDLNQVSAILEPIMFADDTNLFYSHKNINSLFNTVNEELIKINSWFQANKLFLNADKTKYTFFHKIIVRDNIPLKLPKLEINETTIKRVDFIKFLGVLIDDNLTWRKHIHEIEIKMSKDIGILYKTKFLLNRKCWQDIYYAFIHTHLNYANITWASTNPNKLNKKYNKQKHATRIIFNKDRMTHARPLMKQLNILNIYQLNIYQTLSFMFKTKQQLTPNIFLDKFIIQ